MNLFSFQNQYASKLGMGFVFWTYNIIKGSKKDLICQKMKDMKIYLKIYCINSFPFPKYCIIVFQLFTCDNYI